MAPAPDASAGATTALVSPPPAGAKLVSLKLPNMTCSGCAAAVEGDLVKVPGVSNIEFDIGSNNCKFYVADEKLDVKEKLDELAKTNSHIEDWSFADGG
jgi:copper chaperone CopZ